FQKEIRNKVIGFGGHVRITNFDTNTSYEGKPVSIKQDFFPALDGMKEIRHIQVFATKAGIIKSGNEMEGIVLKGIGSDFDWNFFRNKIIEGKPFTVSDSGITKNVLISKYTAQKLKLKTGDKLVTYFIQKPP